MYPGRIAEETEKRVFQALPGQLAYYAKACGLPAEGVKLYYPPLIDTLYYANRHLAWDMIYPKSKDGRRYGGKERFDGADPLDLVLAARQLLHHFVLTALGVLEKERLAQLTQSVTDQKVREDIEHDIAFEFDKRETDLLREVNAWARPLIFQTVMASEADEQMAGALEAMVQQIRRLRGQT